MSDTNLHEQESRQDETGCGDAGGAGLFECKGLVREMDCRDEAT